VSEERVTLKDVYEVVNRIEDKMSQRIAETERRVDILESFQSRTLGVLSIITVFISLAATWVWGKITGE
jgi:hypothetical protein